MSAREELRGLVEELTDEQVAVASTLLRGILLATSLAGPSSQTADNLADAAERTSADGLVDN